MFNIEQFNFGGIGVVFASTVYEYAKRFMDAYAAVMRPLSEELGMARPAVDILLFLANNPEHPTARDICAYRRMKPAIVSFHVDNLVREGYLERQPVPGDRRKQRLVCTEKAEVVIRRGREFQERFYAQMVRGLTREELDGCLRCFAVMERNLSAQAGENPRKEEESL